MSTNTQTARNVFPTSIPAHRSTAAQIISLLLSGRRTADIFTKIFLLGSTAPFGDPICRPDKFSQRLRLLHYVERPSFSCLPLIWHIFISGDERNAHRVFSSWCVRRVY